ncbi:hypothetical protein HPB50_020470 [Hyalomma asiaticum]|uniref:Uncharacterized protein n=1 Tax=Hyalomma asiaticum TaxID=266040 RepID=A0ACB7T5L6_HYAAI|nr:hypothetical protein HPB50_020470 [Hyalomma asiaticum]
MGKWAKYARNYKKEWEKEPDFKAAGPLASFVDGRPRELKVGSDDLKVAELRLPAHLAVHGSFLTADHLTPVISGCFRDSVLTSAVTLGRTKCAALVTKICADGVFVNKFSNLDTLKGELCSK